MKFQTFKELCITAVELCRERGIHSGRSLEKNPLKGFPLSVRHFDYLIAASKAEEGEKVHIKDDKVISLLSWIGHDTKKYFVVSEKK